jgi:membrane-bound acyltransferase YfiQ involved in biofilm formation
MLRAFFRASSATQWLILTAVIFMAVIIVGWVYAFARLPYNRSGYERTNDVKEDINDVKDINDKGQGTK